MHVFKGNIVGFLLLAGVLAGTSWQLTGSAHAAEVKKTDDLASVGKTAQARRLPVLMVFSSSHCGYCEMLENEILKPMLISGDYTDKIIIRKIVLDDAGFIKNFDGSEMPIGDISTKYDVRVTPTMLFVDGRGKEVAKRIIGINTIDFFGGDVDNAIDEAIKNIRAKDTRVGMVR